MPGRLVGVTADVVRVFPDKIGRGLVLPLAGASRDDVRERGTDRPTPGVADLVV